DHYFINDDDNPAGNDPQVAIAFGDGTLAATSAAYTSTDIAEMSFTVILAPGESLSVMSFAAQSQDAAALSATAAMLSGSATAAMQEGIPQSLAETIVNYAVTGTTETPDFLGSALAELMTGTDGDEQFFAQEGADTVEAGGGADVILAGAGNDSVTAGAGNDTVDGGTGNDLVWGGDGADIVHGDGVLGAFASAQVEIAETGQILALDAHVPSVALGQPIWIEGAVSRQAASAEGLNLVYVIDTSGSMQNIASGASVGDLNGDGLADRLIDVAIAGFDALSDALALSGYASSDLQIVAFDNDAVVIFEGALGAGSNNAFVGVMPSGDTSFQTALQATIGALDAMGPGDNRVVFVSDGAPTDGASFMDEVQTLTDPDGLDAHITALGIGAGASLFHLDLVDDATFNSSATLLGTPEDVVQAVLGPSVETDEISELRILVNDEVAMVLPSSAFTHTPTGLTFAVDISDVINTPNDPITIELVAADGAATTVSIALTGADLTQMPGADTVSGGAGDDILAGDGGDDLLSGDDGADSLSGGLGADTLRGGAGDDLLIGDGGNDQLEGGAGSDTLVGGGGVDLVNYAASAAAVVVNLGTQNGAGGDAEGDVLSGITGVIGTQFDDQLIGSAGDDVFRPGLGDDTILAAEGFDTLDLSDLNGAVYLSLVLQGAPQQGWSAGHMHVDGVEALIGSDFDDYLLGDAGFNDLFGGAGNDVIKSKGGDDLLHGGAGDDTIRGDTGDETIHGDDGADELYGLAGADVIWGGDGDDYISAGSGNDIVQGDSGADTLRANRGNDTVYGGTGADDIRGGGGHDLILGEAGDDFLVGENGRDTLFGGLGDDILLGGGDDDVFQFGAGMGFDEARDFTQGDDLLDFTSFGFASFSELASFGSDRSTGLRLDFGGGDVAFITGLTLAELTASDVIL
ncbi:MAG: hypothetical protein AAF754_12410, partial [Pseudomonadota bacterium]